MTDAPPLTAAPEDRPLPPSGGRQPAAPAPEAAPSAGAGAERPAALAAAIAPHTRPIGRLARPRGDWRRAWPGFLAGTALVAVAVALAWVVWDLGGTPRAVLPPPRQVPAAELAEIELLLDALGFPPGSIDGVIDADAVAAIRDFQATAGLAADGAPSFALLEELRAAHTELFGAQ